MRLEGLDVRLVALPLVAPFRTSFGTETIHEVLVLTALTDVGVGWAECVAMERPAYSSEYHEGCADVLRRFLVPEIGRAGDLDASDVAGILGWVKGHRMAKAAIETALLDAQLRAAGVSFATHLGAVRDRVPAGVSVGIMDSIDDLLAAVSRYRDEGYVRIKLKIEPGWDVEPVRQVRALLGPDVGLQVDANTAYTRDDGDHLARLDEFDLLLIEQPLDEEDLVGHARLARRLATPVCLDESIVSARSALDAIEMGAAEIVNIKPGRVGGYRESVAIHDVCVAHEVPVWCGGMLETGVGRAANLALAALPGFTLPGDTSASDRYYARDLTAPFVLEDGHLRVPDGPGIGVEPDPDVLDSVTVWRDVLRP